MTVAFGQDVQDMSGSLWLRPATGVAWMPGNSPGTTGSPIAEEPKPSKLAVEAEALGLWT
jgi:hypothetical protein